jgi:nitrite reductase (NADH) small subunit
MSAVLEKYFTTNEEEVKVWFKAALVENFPENGGACVKYKDKQIAVFNFTREKKWKWFCREE